MQQDYYEKKLREFLKKNPYAIHDTRFLKKLQKELEDKYILMELERDLQLLADGKPIKQSKKPVTHTVQENETKKICDEILNAGKADKLRVINYIKVMTGQEIIDTISSEYQRIKNICAFVPAMGIYGSFEFAGALLIWSFCRKNLTRRFTECGRLMIDLGDNIGCAFCSMPAGEWSDRMDRIINNNEVLDYAEWNEIYNYLKYNFEKEIHLMEFNEGLTTVDLRDTIYRLFIDIYNNCPNYRSTFELFTKVGLRLKEDMPFEING